MSTRTVLVTGGNAGIGLALCKQLVSEDGCRVFLASRSLDRGQAALDTLKRAGVNVDLVDLVQLDVTSDESVQRAAADVKARCEDPLFAVINNAGTGLAHKGVSPQDVINTNLYGPKRVCDAFIPLLHPTEGRIVNVASGAGPMWLRNQSIEVNRLLSSPSVTWAQLDDVIRTADLQGFGGYGASKACLSAFTMELARIHPNLLSSAISPGYIRTAMCPGGSKLPEDGTVSIRHCLFGDRAKLGNGWYWGSDARRSPLTRTRDPGTAEYRGKPEC